MLKQFKLGYLLMILFDYISMQPMDELQSAWERVPSDEYAKGGLKGRAVCVWKTCYHTIALVLKPIVYIALGSMMVGTNATLQAQCLAQSLERRLDLQQIGTNLILTGLVAPIGQIVQLFKAAMGILYPGFYFREDELSVYFNQLADLAKELDCEPELVDIFKNGAYTVSTSQIMDSQRNYYRALFKRDLAIICEKLSDDALPQDEKISILQMFAPLPSDPSGSGIAACNAGLGRLLEQICACLDVPKQPEKILPWLVVQYKEEILHQMVMQAEVSGKYLRIADLPEMKDSKMDAAHFGNILIVILGEKIGLSEEMIDQASQDIFARNSCLSESEQQELFDQFNQLFTEEALETYLMERINSQPDGKPGLKNLRDYIIQKLAENVSESEIEASKKEVQDKFAVSEILSDEPIFYVKLHYYCYPDAMPSDENSSDLNVEGIKAFTATLENDPFAYFTDASV